MSDSPRPLRVAVDNDIPIVIMGLSAMLAGHTDRINVVDLETEAASGIDVVLKDAFALNEDLEVYVTQAPGRVVVFASTAEEAAVQAALEQGAAGYVHKSASIEELVDALERVHSGERVVMGVRESDDPVGTPDWPGRAEGLSDRESEVLTLICQGLSNQQVAQKLYLSINSVKTYIRILYRKIGAESRSQAVIWGMQHGFGTKRSELPPQR